MSLTAAAPEGASADYDWAAFAARLGDVPVERSPGQRRKKSRDFYWYSPLLKERLDGLCADLVVTARNEADVVRVAAECARARVPLTVRGAGTGNYGQAMPLEGGVVLDISGMDRLISLEGGVVRVEAGIKMLDLDNLTRPQGWEMRQWPSTRRTATVGGFLAGGSTGVGGIAWGLLADRGAVNAVRVVTCEETPRVLELRGDAIAPVLHAYGTNGIVTEVELALEPTAPWVDIVVAFDDFMAAAEFCMVVAGGDGMVKKLVTAIAAPVPQWLPTLRRAVPAGQHIVMLMLAEWSLDWYRELRDRHGGTEVYRRTEAEVAAANLVPLYEYSWNHTTLYALKTDPTITYLQTLFAPPDPLAKVKWSLETFGDETPMHLEFVRLGGWVGCFGLQLVRYRSPERLAEIIRIHEDNGCPIFDPHTHIIEDGGMKRTDARQLAFKREADPHGLLNPGKLRGWKATP